MQRQNPNDSSYRGFEYRWNYDEYQKSLQKQRRKASAGGMQAFFLTTAFVFLICFVSLVMVLGAAFMRGSAAAPIAEGHADVQNTENDANGKNVLPEKTDEEKAVFDDSTSASADMENIPIAPPVAISEEDMPNLLGILGESITSADAKRFRLPIGIRIMNVVEDQIADRAGLRRDDILLAIENTQITTLAELAAWEATASKGKSVSVRIYRGGEELLLTFTVDTNSEY